MKFDRASGILLHPTSLPGPYGIGDLGPQAHAWVDFLVQTGCSYWQVLPLGPTGYGDSPYQCFSAFAGNPYLVSPDLLLEEGLLHPQDLHDAPDFPDERVDYGSLIPWKIKLLDKAYAHFKTAPPASLPEQFQAFAEKNKNWLLDYALFMSLKDAHHGQAWPGWEPALRSRQPAAIEQARREYTDDIVRHMFRQFVFFKQWNALKSYANRSGIQIIGDIPIFVAHDSAEVWARPDLFFMDSKGQPTVVAGVPPDYFSPTGQLWGNPLYRWEVHAASGYDWWIQRFKAVFELVDLVRLDHFRGFAGYWEVPAGEETAENGLWKPGPGQEFFKVIKNTFGELPIIAEDLGEITPDVVALRKDFDLPGMKILVFAFGDDASSDFLPHNYTADFVVYTGTHDNDTVLGWYQRVDEKERDFARRYLGRSGKDISWDLIRQGWASVASIAIAQMQDVLVLDNQARMNYPSRPSGNWQWRMLPEAIKDWHIAKLAEYNVIYGRGVPPEEDAEELTEENITSTVHPADTSE